ncbi:MAG: GHKL domain-containing protein, partial [Deltaproteobacteria bacterium]|nr:GHKL domain-containing protein [Deltaproteobacteria bacterium]
SEALDEAAGHTLDGEAKGHLNRVRDASRRMSELVEGLLQLSRVTRAPLEKSDIDLSQLAAAILDDLRAHDRERQIDILLAPGLTTRGSPQLLRVAMQNLLDNAWKYTRRTDKPQLELGQKQLEREVAYYVKDNGAGFDPAYAQKLFQPFQRLHPASQFEGTGIGLATVARIVQRHGGRIWAEGRPGEGATFWFTLG